MKNHYILLVRPCNVHNKQRRVPCVFVCDVIRENYWLGLSDGAVEGVFRWITTSVLTWDNWAPEQPTVENCALIDGDSGRFKTEHCSSFEAMAMCQSHTGESL